MFILVVTVFVNIIQGPKWQLSSLKLVSEGGKVEAILYASGVNGIHYS